MITGRQYYEIPLAGGCGAGNAVNGHGVHRFDPTFGHGYGHGYSCGGGGGQGGYHYDRNHGTRQEDDNVKPTRAAPAARQSLSALDEKRANEIRRGVYAHVFLDVKNSRKSDVL